MSNILIKSFFLLLFTKILFISSLYSDNDIDSLKNVLKSVIESEKPKVLNALAKMHLENFPVQARIYARQARDLAVKYQNRKEEGNARQYIGNSYESEGKYDLALRSQNIAKKIRLEIGDKKGLAKSYHAIGDIQSNNGDYDSALESYQKALKLKEDLGATQGMAISFIRIGELYFLLGQYDKAKKFNQKALRIFEEYDHKEGIAGCFNMAGLIYEEWEKYPEAIQFYENSLRIENEINDVKRSANTLNNLGNVYHKRGKAFGNKEDYLKAKEYYQKSQAIREKINDKKGIASSLNNIGTIYTYEGKHDKAQNYYKKALKINEELNNQYEISVNLFSLGENYKDLNQYEKALESYRRSIEIAKQIKLSDKIKDNYKGFSEVYAAMGNFNKSLEYYKKYIVVTDSIFNEKSHKQIMELQTKYETENKVKEIALLTKENEIKDLELNKKETDLNRKKAYQIYLIIFSFLVALVAVLLFRSYQFKQKHYRSELERKNLEIEKRLLRSQMNPHFIFNSLNSIQSFISENDSFSAESYLSKFARLMRYILENSRKSFVYIQDEINTLSLNMELEKLRFDNKFDFTINVSKDIDSENTAIPPMLIQPFIENAIIHGIMNKPTKGHISIGFSNGIDTDVLLCTVEDDGIGRKKSNELKTTIGSKHQSLGLQVTKERLAILNQQVKSRVYVNIIDLTDNTGNGIGTRVELSIPYEVEAY